MIAPTVDLLVSQASAARSGRSAGSRARSVQARAPSRRGEGSCPGGEMSGADCRPGATRCARQRSLPLILRLRSPTAWRARCPDTGGLRQIDFRQSALCHQGVEVVPVTTFGPAHRPAPPCEAPLRQDAPELGVARSPEAAEEPFPGQMPGPMRDAGTADCPRSRSGISRPGNC